MTLIATLAHYHLRLKFWIQTRCLWINSKEIFKGWMNDDLGCWLLIPSCFLISIHHFLCVEELKIFEIQCRQCIIEQDLKINVQGVIDDQLSSCWYYVTSSQIYFELTLSQYERILALAKLDWNIYHRGRWRVLFVSVQTPWCRHDTNKIMTSILVVSLCLSRAVLQSFKSFVVTFLLCLDSNFLDRSGWKVQLQSAYITFWYMFEILRFV